MHFIMLQSIPLISHPNKCWNSEKHPLILSVHDYKALQRKCLSPESFDRIEMKMQYRHGVGRVWAKSGSVKLILGACNPMLCIPSMHTFLVFELSVVL